MPTHQRSGAGSVYFDHKQGTGCRDSRYHKSCTGRWSASLSLGLDGGGKRIRKRVTASTKTGLLEKLKELQKAAETGLDVSTTYTVGQCFDDFLASLEGLAPKTIEVQTYSVARLKPVLGAHKLRELSAKQALDGLRTIAGHHATRTVSIAHNTLTRAITLA